MDANEFAGCGHLDVPGNVRVYMGDGSGLGYICDACFGWGDGFGSDCCYGFGISNSDNGWGDGSGDGSY